VTKEKIFSYRIQKMNVFEMNNSTMHGSGDESDELLRPRKRHNTFNGHSLVREDTEDQMATEKKMVQRYDHTQKPYTDDSEKYDIVNPNFHDKTFLDGKDDLKFKKYVQLAIAHSICEKTAANNRALDDILHSRYNEIEYDVDAYIAAFAVISAKHYDKAPEQEYLNLFTYWNGQELSKEHKHENTPMDSVKRDLVRKGIWKLVTKGGKFAFRNSELVRKLVSKLTSLVGSTPEKVRDMIHNKLQKKGAGGTRRYRNPVQSLEDAHLAAELDEILKKRVNKSQRMRYTELKNYIDEKASPKLQEVMHEYPDRFDHVLNEVYSHGSYYDFKKRVSDIQQDLMSHTGKSNIADAIKVQRSKEIANPYGNSEFNRRKIISNDFIMASEAERVNPLTIKNKLTKTMFPLRKGTNIRKGIKGKVGGIDVNTDVDKPLGIAKDVNTRLRRMGLQDDIKWNPHTRRFEVPEGPDKAQLDQVLDFIREPTENSLRVVGNNVTDVLENLESGGLIDAMMGANGTTLHGAAQDIAYEYNVGIYEQMTSRIATSAFRRTFPRLFEAVKRGMVRVLNGYQVTKKMVNDILVDGVLLPQINELHDDLFAQDHVFENTIKERQTFSREASKFNGFSADNVEKALLRMAKADPVLSKVPITDLIEDAKNAGVFNEVGNVITGIWSGEVSDGMSKVEAAFRSISKFREERNIAQATVEKGVEKLPSSIKENPHFKRAAAVGKEVYASNEAVKKVFQGTTSKDVSRRYWHLRKTAREIAKGNMDISHVNPRDRTIVKGLLQTNADQLLANIKEGKIPLLYTEQNQKIFKLQEMIQDLFPQLKHDPNLSEIENVTRSIKRTQKITTLLMQQNPERLLKSYIEKRNAGTLRMDEVTGEPIDVRREAVAKYRMHKDIVPQVERLTNNAVEFTEKLFNSETVKGEDRKFEAIIESENLRESIFRKNFFKAVRFGVFKAVPFAAKWGLKAGGATLSLGAATVEELATLVTGENLQNLSPRLRFAIYEELRRQAPTDKAREAYYYAEREHNKLWEDEMSAKREQVREAIVKRFGEKYETNKSYADDLDRMLEEGRWDELRKLEDVLNKAKPRIVQQNGMLYDYGNVEEVAMYQKCYDNIMSWVSRWRTPAEEKDGLKTVEEAIQDTEFLDSQLEIAQREIQAAREEVDQYDRENPYDESFDSEDDERENGETEDELESADEGMDEVGEDEVQEVERKRKRKYIEEMKYASSDEEEEEDDDFESADEGGEEEKAGGEEEKAGGEEEFENREEVNAEKGKGEGKAESKISDDLGYGEDDLTKRFIGDGDMNLRRNDHTYYDAHEQNVPYEEAKSLDPSLMGLLEKISTFDIVKLGRQAFASLVTEAVAKGFAEGLKSYRKFMGKSAMPLMFLMVADFAEDQVRSGVIKDKEDEKMQLLMGMVKLLAKNMLEMQKMDTRLYTGNQGDPGTLRNSNCKVTYDFGINEYGKAILDYRGANKQYECRTLTPDAKLLMHFADARDKYQVIKERVQNYDYQFVYQHFRDVILHMPGPLVIRGSTFNSAFRQQLEYKQKADEQNKELGDWIEEHGELGRLWKFHKQRMDDFNERWPNAFSDGFKGDKDVEVPVSKAWVAKTEMEIAKLKTIKHPSSNQRVRLRYLEKQDLHRRATFGEWVNINVAQRLDRYMINAEVGMKDFLVGVFGLPSITKEEYEKRMKLTEESLNNFVKPFFWMGFDMATFEFNPVVWKGIVIHYGVMAAQLGCTQEEFLENYAQLDPQVSHLHDQFVEAKDDIERTQNEIELYRGPQKEEFTRVQKNIKKVATAMFLNNLCELTTEFAPILPGYMQCQRTGYFGDPYNEFTYDILMGTDTFKYYQEQVRLLQEYDERQSGKSMEQQRWSYGEEGHTFDKRGNVDSDRPYEQNEYKGLLGSDIEFNKRKKTKDNWVDDLKFLTAEDECYMKYLVVLSVCEAAELSIHKKDLLKKQELQLEAYKTGFMTGLNPLLQEEVMYHLKHILDGNSVFKTKPNVIRVHSDLNNAPTDGHDDELKDNTFAYFPIYDEDDLRIALTPILGPDNPFLDDWVDELHLGYRQAIQFMEDERDEERSRRRKIQSDQNEKERKKKTIKPKQLTTKKALQLNPLAGRVNGDETVLVNQQAVYRPGKKIDVPKSNIKMSYLTKNTSFTYSRKRKRLEENRTFL
jgi:hypothetical protein